MTIVVSNATLLDMPVNWWPSTSGSISLYNSYSRTYAALYREQPNVRVCVDFLARNIAQLGLHVFRRVSDTDRVRLTDHPLAQVLARPLPAEFKVSYYRLIDSLMSDLGIYFNAYWLKVPVQDGPMGLLRVPPEYVTPLGGLVITGYEVTIGGELKTYKPGQVVHFRGHNAESAITGLSPLETLRRVLAEEHAAGDYREYFWQNAARMNGVIERPTTAPEWSDPARERFKAEFEALYSGSEQSGKTAVLEEGMTWKGISFNAQESEYLGGRKLTREECARAYHIPLPMVGILDHATFSNITEQHKNLYQDSLGPWLAMIEDDIELQLLPEFDDTNGVYVEFNINEKLQGSFGEQVTSLQSAVGRPWMTANEARARFNLPELGGDADRLVTPMNVTVGGQASPRDTAPKSLSMKQAMDGIDSHRPELRQGFEDRWAEVLARHYRRQERAVLSRLPKSRKAPQNSTGAKAQIGDIWWDEERWDQELAADLLKLNKETAVAYAEALAEQLGVEVDPDRMEAWLKEHSDIQAEAINDYTQEQLEAAVLAPDPNQAIKDLFLLAITVWARRQAMTGVTTAGNFGAFEGAKAGGLKSKRWKVNSANPRPEHAAMNGQVVPIGSLFSNGARWPGDPVLGAAGNSNCQCSCVFER
jgi:HK97 family phage portal protein